MRKRKFKEVRWLSKYLWWNIMLLQIPCTPVQWRENWTKCQETCVTLISACPGISYVSLCKYECVCIGNWIRISKLQILRHLTLKNFFFTLVPWCGYPCGHSEPQAPSISWLRPPQVLSSKSSPLSQQMERKNERLPLTRPGNGVHYFHHILLAIIQSQGHNNSKEIWEMYSSYVPRKKKD